LQDLLVKTSWSRLDRVTWEQEVSTIVSEEMARIQGLSEYRLADYPDKYPETQRRATRLNDLAYDIEHGTKTIEHDCETMSAIEGIVLQQVENHFLPEAAVDGDYKVRSNYFYVGGRISQNKALRGHAYIISSATANIIEGTALLASPYYENIDPDYSFENFVAGKPAIMNDGSIYGGKTLDKGDIAALRVERGELSINTLYDRVNLSWASVTGDGSMPSGVASLIETKRMLEKAQHIVVERGNYTDIEMGMLNGLRKAFDLQVDALLESGEIYEVLAFIDEKEQQAFLAPAATPFQSADIVTTTVKP
ncbi:MAG: hypothetical protein ACPGRX_05075, partial [Bdellovibrionales bacterium]